MTVFRIVMIEALRGLPSYLLTSSMVVMTTLLFTSRSLGDSLSTVPVSVSPENSGLDGGAWMIDVSLFTFMVILVVPPDVGTSRIS